MKYESLKTAKGNIGASYESQESADAQARVMDESNCTNCTNCIDCDDCIGCADCIDCDRCARCTNCDRCTRCYLCTSCTNCTGVMLWLRNNANRLLALNGLRWPVAVSKTQMQIGCRNHTHEEWDKFSDKEIGKMAEGALAFWKEWKPTLMAMCAHKRQVGHE